MIERIVQNRDEKNSKLNLRMLNISALAPISRQVLVEKHLISPLLAKESRFSAIVLRDDEVISIMVNEEDHFRIQCLMPGLQLEKAWQEASYYDDFLESQVDYAFHEEKSTLQHARQMWAPDCDASIMLHLPALSITRQINRILSAVNQVGLAVRGLYGEGTEAVGNYCRFPIR